MKLSHIFAASAVALCAMQASAQSITVADPGPGFAYGALTFSSGTLPYGTTNVSDASHLAPLGVTGEYSFISTGGSATINFAAGVTSFSFLWGSPDTYNEIVVDGMSFTGLDVVAAPNGSNANTKLVTVLDAGGIDSITFNATGVAFELASVTAVPEPETYALMLAGLAAIGFVARRRKNA